MANTRTMTECITQTQNDKTQSWALLQEAQEADQIDQTIQLVKASSLLANPEEIKQAQNASVWFVQSGNSYFKVTNNEQLVPKDSQAMRSVESSQLLRINAVVGG